jgi:hypothetical protein
MMSSNASFEVLIFFQARHEDNPLLSPLAGLSMAPVPPLFADPRLNPVVIEPTLTLFISRGGVDTAQNVVGD